MVTEQIPMQFAWQDGFSFENYFMGAALEGNIQNSNAEAVHQLQRMSAGEIDAEQFLFLWGFTSSGKSHLLQAACQQAADSGLTVAYLPLTELGDLQSEMFAGLEQLSLVCIDDVQLLAENKETEEALFHLYNRMRDAGSKLLVAGDAAPNALQIKLADLQSRLTWGPVFYLQELSDENKIDALQLRAKVRGFELTEEVGLFLIRRSARDMISLFALLDRLDEASLAQHRKLTIPFVRGLI